MNKPAESQYPLHELIRDRWSPVLFDERLIEPEKVGSLLEAARWAPSSYNEQPWVYFIATRDNADEFDRLFGCLVEANRPWVQQVPLLMLAVARLNFDRNGKPNRHAQHDVGLANENIVLQATALGLATHQIAGFDAAEARKRFDIPEGYLPLTMLAVGYPGDAADSPTALRQRDEAPRSRKLLSEMVFAGKWGRAAELD